jgi:hypothetical protein
MPRPYPDDHCVRPGSWLTDVVEHAEVHPMGLLDRVKAAFGGGDHEPAEPVDIPDVPLDVDARRTQLDELSAALTALVQAMSADTDRMRNPGWRGRVEDLRFGAAEAARLSRRGFDRVALLDLAAEVRPLYGSGPVPPEYAPYQTKHERVTAAAQALRAPLPSESGHLPE